MKTLVSILFLALAGTGASAATADVFPEAPRLRAEAASLGKPGWRPLLEYVADLHIRSTHPATAPFQFPWEEIGPGYTTAFGHWDIIHQIIDVLPTTPEHARQQLLNDVRLQLGDGFLPGSIWMPGSAQALRHGNRPTFNTSSQGHPPLWVVAAQDYMDITGRSSDLREFFTRATRQIGWFEANRACKGGGFFYSDITSRLWESGVDEGARFDRSYPDPLACVDATSHVYQLYEFAARWAERLGENPEPWRGKARRLREFIRTRMWDERDGFFYDAWAKDDPKLRVEAFEGLWPLMVGAADHEQAMRVIDGWLLNPARFFSRHPIASLGVSDPRFEPRMWRGPTWNSTTYWAARACVAYGRPEAASRLLAAALDDSAEQFRRTGTIWEFYDAQGGFPESLERKPASKADHNPPCHDYLGHNPLLAMARLWQQLNPGRNLP